MRHYIITAAAALAITASPIGSEIAHAKLSKHDKQLVIKYLNTSDHKYIKMLMHGVALYGVLTIKSHGRPKDVTFVLDSSNNVMLLADAPLQRIANLSTPSKVKDERLSRLPHLFSVDSKARVKGNDVWVFIDPNCPYCHKIITDAKSGKTKGLNIHFVPIYILQGTTKADAQQAIDSHNVSELLEHAGKHTAKRYTSTAEADYNLSIYESLAYENKGSVPFAINKQGVTFVGYNLPNFLNTYKK